MGRSSKALYVKKHRQMWNDIADEIERRQCLVDILVLKSDWCVKHKVFSDMWCFACEYCSGLPCHVRCLFNWQSDTAFTRCGHGYYRACKFAETWQEQAHLARLIANLPARQEV